MSWPVPSLTLPLPFSQWPSSFSGVASQSQVTSDNTRAFLFSRLGILPLRSAPHPICSPFLLPSPPAAPRVCLCAFNVSKGLSCIHHRDYFFKTVCCRFASVARIPWPGGRGKSWLQPQCLGEKGQLCHHPARHGQSSVSSCHCLRRPPWLVLELP